MHIYLKYIPAKLSLQVIFCSIAWSLEAAWISCYSVIITISSSDFLQTLVAFFLKI